MHRSLCGEMGDTAWFVCGISGPGRAVGGSGGRKAWMWGGGGGIKAKSPGAFDEA
jgi:hypothetical protein